MQRRDENVGAGCAWICGCKMLRAWPTGHRGACHLWRRPAHQQPASGRPSPSQSRPELPGCICPCALGGGVAPILGSAKPRRRVGSVGGAGMEEAAKNPEGHPPFPWPFLFQQDGAWVRSRLIGNAQRLRAGRFERQWGKAVDSDRDGKPRPKIKRGRPAHLGARAKGANRGLAFFVRRRESRSEIGDPSCPLHTAAHAARETRGRVFQPNTTARRLPCALAASRLMTLD